MKLLNKEFDFNFEEAENIDKIAELDKKYQERIEKTNNLIEKCKIYKEFFDELIGKGTSDKLFGAKNNLFEIMDVYQELIEEAERIVEKVNERATKMKQKYERYK